MAGEQSPHGFQIVMRGFDRAQVEERIASLESSLRDARARVEELDTRALKLSGEVAEAHRQLREVERPPTAVSVPASSSCCGWPRSRPAT